MVPEVAKENAQRTRYQTAVTQCRKALRSSVKYPRSPLQRIRRRLSIGSIRSNITLTERNTYTEISDRLNKTTLGSPQIRKPPLQRSNSTVWTSSLQMDSNSKDCNSNSPQVGSSGQDFIKCSRAMSQLDKSSQCASCKGYLRAKCRCRAAAAPSSGYPSKDAANDNYSSLSQALSSISELSSTRDQRLQRRTPLNSSLPVLGRYNRPGRNLQTVETVLPIFTTLHESSNGAKQKMTSMQSYNCEDGGAGKLDLHPRRDPDSSVLSSSESQPCIKILVSPTRDDELENDSNLQKDDSNLEGEDSLNATADFTSFLEPSESNTSLKTRNHRGRLSVDSATILSQQELKGEKKNKGRFRRLAREHMRMWSQRRHTIETEDQARRHQSMLRVSSSGRISLRQKNMINPENRLSLFGNTTESLLMLMQQPEMLQAFRTFLRSEYSEENLDFWLDCESYRHLKSNRRKKTAAKIYATYLDEKAPREINIDARTRAKTESHLDNPTEKTFEDAQRHIFDLMENDSFRRFISADKQG